MGDGPGRDGSDATGGPASPARELRRGYHDRIADLRDRSVRVVGSAARCAAAASGSFLDHDPEVPVLVRAEVDVTATTVGEIDAEVLALLALQSPVARDLRLILAARDVTQTAALCLGLAATLAARTPAAAAELGEVRPVAERTAELTVDLLRRADVAWSGLDEQTARDVVACAATARDEQVRLLRGIVGLQFVPVEAAVDLGMAARVYSRLCDHAVEIAGRVLFVVSGVPAVSSGL